MASIEISLVAQGRANRDSGVLPPKAVSDPALAIDMGHSNRVGLTLHQWCKGMLRGAFNIKRIGL